MALRIDHRRPDPPGRDRLRDGDRECLPRAANVPCHGIRNDGDIMAQQAVYDRGGGGGGAGAPDDGHAQWGAQDSA